MIITKTPFRVSFFGGGTDFPEWYREHGGAVLSTAIDKYCYLNCRYLPPFFEHHSRVIYSEVENVRSNGDIRHPAIRAGLQQAGISAGVEIHHDADLPARTGLGTSSSFVVGLLSALHALLRQRPDPHTLAAEAIRLERVVLAEFVGTQDQIAAAFGGLNLIKFGPGDDFRVQPLVLRPERLHELETCLHLYFTGFTRVSSQISQAHLVNIPHRAEELKEMTAMAQAAAEILLDAQQPLTRLGQLMHEAWRLKRAMGSHVSTPAIDTIYERGLQAGALGGKLLGAGGGGFVLFFVAPSSSRRFQAAMQPLLRVPIKLAAPGCRLIVDEPEAENYDSHDSRRTRTYAQSG